VLALFGDLAIDEVEDVANVARQMFAGLCRRSLPVILCDHVVSRREHSAGIATTTRKHHECLCHEVVNVVAASHVDALVEVTKTSVRCVHFDRLVKPLFVPRPPERLNGCAVLDIVGHGFSSRSVGAPTCGIIRGSSS
jgi:hypothetical protein